MITQEPLVPDTQDELAHLRELAVEREHMIHYDFKHAIESDPIATAATDNTIQVDFICGDECEPHWLTAREARVLAARLISAANRVECENAALDHHGEL